MIMKTLFYSSTLAIAMLFTACDKDTDEPIPADNNESSSILPARFGVDIPSSLSAEPGTVKSGLLKSAQEEDDFSGNEIYQNLNTFIAVGESASELVDTIMHTIITDEINQPMTFSYLSDEDLRTKNLIVAEEASYDGKTYDYSLKITDAVDEVNEDKGIAMMVYWSLQPTKGVAILKPYNINRIENPEANDAIYKIEYTEEGNNDYDSYMIVSIANLPLPANEPYAINSLKMFAGKKGEYIDVYGNTNHPKATFFTDNEGFDWAFVASSIEDSNLGVAEVGLPPVDLNTSDRNKILKDYSIKQVFTNEINNYFMAELGIKPDADYLASRLSNADAPGYFDVDGFIQSGTAPNENYEAIANRIEALAPYNPFEVQNLTINVE